MVLLEYASIPAPFSRCIAPFLDTTPLLDRFAFRPSPIKVRASAHSSEYHLHFSSSSLLSGIGCYRASYSTQSYPGSAPPLPACLCTSGLPPFLLPRLVSVLGARSQLSQLVAAASLQARDETILCCANHFSLWDVVAEICPSLGRLVSGVALVGLLCYLPRVFCLCLTHGVIAVTDDVLCRDLLYVAEL